VILGGGGDLLQHRGGRGKVRHGQKGKETAVWAELTEVGEKRRWQLRFQWRRWLPGGQSGPVVTSVRCGPLRTRVSDGGGVGKFFTTWHR
jgi:hypothetical protein